MKLIESLEGIVTPFKNAVITIGNFDGVHIGHKILFRKVVEHARRINGTALVMTFDPHPQRVLAQNSHPPLITLIEQKVELIESNGIEGLIVVPFTREFAQIPALTFVTDLLVKRIGMKAIVIGKDYAFGKNRQGNIDFLKQHAQPMGYEVIVADCIQDAKTRSRRISSTRIRELVQAGKTREAKVLLGRFYQIRGTVERGRNRGGKLLGFSTANIRLVDELAPNNGVYVVTVEWGIKKYLGVANIGYSPTFDDHLYTVEVHILDFAKDLVGEKIRVNFIDRIRDEIQFTDLAALSEKIKDDIELARQKQQTYLEEGII